MRIPGHAEHRFRLTNIEGHPLDIDMKATYR
jgi:hypothetical protein